MTPCGRSCHSLCICAVNSPVSPGRLRLPSQRVLDILYWRRSGDLAGHAWVAQSALKYRPRICELSKCLEGPLKIIVCPKKFLPHTVTPCEIAVCRSTINAGSDRWLVRLQTRVQWSSSLRLNRFITEDDTSPVCHTPSCPRSAKIQSTLPMMWGQW
ncbi:hypothetical protein TNCV_3444561 [Trichonephila clavipes]|nr:hypothetical protein TNCV_3444561 [Trichonephila clavipes]